MGDIIQLGTEPASVGQARRFCAAKLTDWQAPPDTIELVTLLVSEVVTNVVLHAGTPCELAIWRGQKLRVEVADGSDTMPVRKHYEIDAGSGRGMYLLDLLSDSHGIEIRPGGKLVWFEVGWPNGA